MLIYFYFIQSILSAKCRKQTSDINSLLSDNKKLMSQVIKLNNRFEYCQKRIRELEEKCNSRKKHRKEFTIYSSTDEEYGI